MMTFKVASKPFTFLKVIYKTSSYLWLMIWRKVLIMILKRKRKSLAFIRGGKVSGMKSDGANLMLYYLECQGGRELLMSFIKYNYCMSSAYFNYRKERLKIGSMSIFTNISWNICIGTRYQMSVLEYSFVCNWRMLVWHIGLALTGSYEGGSVKAVARNPTAFLTGRQALLLLCGWPHLTFKWFSK